MIGLKLQGKLKKNFSLICLVALAGSVIFALPLLRLEYYGSYMKEYHLTNTEMGILASVLGVFGVVSYLFGGVVADGISLRKIVVCSLLGTGAGGLLHLLPLSFKGLLLVYALWGNSTTFAF
jgi:MFS transporter